MITPAFNPYIQPITLAILVGLFALQSHGNGPGRRLLRAGDGRLVRRPRRAGHCPDRRPPRRPRRSQSVARRGLPADHPTLGSFPGCGRPLHHRRRGALRRHGPFRRQTIRFAWPGGALPASPSITSAGARSCSPIPEAVANPFYLLAPEWARYPPRRARRRGHGHRLPGGHFRRLLDHPPGHPAGLQPAPGVQHTSNRKSGRSPAGHELAADGGRRPGGRSASAPRPTWRPTASPSPAPCSSPICWPS